ncbi:MAG: beta-lactamase family protein [Clostridia bacterium]|nr:beta-lactamase family protein [Clostridia bacterium]
MFEKISPEAAGVSSIEVLEMIASFNRRGFRMHSVLLMKGDKLFCEAYWKPFHKDMVHRMYSVTKSFTSIAIGLCVEDALVDLDAPISSYFPEKIEKPLPEFLKDQTVREMLTMTTVGKAGSWFANHVEDRTHWYFNNERNLRPSGTIWEYDSPGSQVLCSLVEKVTGKEMFDYMYERIFSKIGTFSTAKMLHTPNGDTWGDSAMICTPRDLASFGLFVMREGKWQGQQVMDSKYLKEASSKVVDNQRNTHPSVFDHGYGYQIWRVEGGEGFAFNGLGNQFCICIPRLDLTFVCTADNQGFPFSEDYIAAQFLDRIVAGMNEEALPSDVKSYQKLENYVENLSLYSLKGNEDSPFREKIDGVEYLCENNPLGWEKFSFHFENAKSGELHYTKKEGEMILPFYVNENRFGLFPEEGYSKEKGGIEAPGHRYRDAVSMTWTQENRLQILCQIIDEYFGNLSLTFGFRDDFAFVRSFRKGENFMKDYDGDILAKRK